MPIGKRALLAAVAEEGFRVLAAALREAARAAFEALVEGMAAAQRRGAVREGDRASTHLHRGLGLRA